MQGGEAPRRRACDLRKSQAQATPGMSLKFENRNSKLGDLDLGYRISTLREN
ncbi:MAG TPA: hypothetical protein VFM21_10150 [Terriglobia bacterium]|nr:hypothetical protein [Terriglobia bacterium]